VVLPVLENGDNGSKLKRLNTLFWENLIEIPNKYKLLSKPTCTYANIRSPGSLGAVVLDTADCVLTKRTETPTSNQHHDVT
jgi:hypothetical protein